MVLIAWPLLSESGQLPTASSRAADCSFRRNGSSGAGVGDACASPV
jgi:hypothetical protein